jgi:hypothetical protein
MIQNLVVVQSSSSSIFVCDEVAMEIHKFSLFLVLHK